MVFFYHCGLSLKEHINGKGKDVFANGNDFTLIQLSLWVIVTLGSTINGLSVKMTFKLPRGWYLIQIQDETKKINLLLLHDERFWEQNTLDLQLTKWPLLWCQLFMCTVIIFLIIKIPAIMNQIVYFSFSNQIRQTGPAIRDICIFL